MDHLVNDLVGVVEALLAETGQSAVILVGHNWGGNVCWQVSGSCRVCCCYQVTCQGRMTSSGPPADQHSRLLPGLAIPTA